jgi:carbon monoxide dehydrogenase subunit G
VTRIESHLTRTAQLAAPRDRVWAVLSDVEHLDRLMPDVRSYRRTPAGWRWELEGDRRLGYHVRPSFTVAYDLEPPRAVRFRQVDDGGSAGAAGAFTLRGGGDGGATAVSVQLQLRLDLPVPSFLAGPARGALDAELGRLADGFLARLAAATG